MDYVEGIKTRRKKLGISQLDLAELSELSLATIKDIERGKSNPSLSTMEKINKVLGLEFVLQVRRTF